MHPRKKSLHMSSHILMDDARAEVALIFQELSDRLCRLLKLIEYRAKMEKENARRPPLP